MPEIEAAGRYDVIVIGAGMAGLMAANSLVLHGHRVLLLEKHAVVGGCTMNFERQGFRFEASTHVINGCEAGGMTHEELVKIRAQDRIEPAHDGAGLRGARRRAAWGGERGPGAAARCGRPWDRAAGRPATAGA